MKKITLLVFLSIFLIIGLASPALAADITGERTLNTTGVKAGESFRVTLNVTVSGGTLYSLGIDENLPDGWTVTPVQSDGMTYDSENTQWGLIDDMSSGKKTVIYDVFVPATAETGTYSITGEVSAKEWADGEETERQNNIIGDTDITVGIPDINIYPGDDFKSILLNAPEGSTIYWHEGNYTGTGGYTISNSLHIIGDGVDRVNLTNIGWSGSSGTTIEGIHFITRGLEFYKDSNKNKIRNCIFENSSVQIQDDSLLENCTFTGTSYLRIQTGFGGGTIKNSLFEVSPLRVNYPIFFTPNTNNVSLSNNKFVNNSINREDIYVWKAQNISITNNIFDGISTVSSVIGVSNSVNTVIRNNTFKNCNSGKGAIEFQTGAQKVTTYLNNFINCSSLTSGSGTDVSWSSPSKLSYTYAGKEHIGTLGNYYDQYKSTDADGNGIGDTSYPIGSGTDYSPLISPIENYSNITVAALQLPVSDFDSNVTSGFAPLSVNFTDLSTNSPTSWAWDFDNDGKVDSIDQNPTYTFTAAGNYTVNLTVTNSVGSNSTVKTDYINVSESSTPTEPTPVAAFTADVTSGIAPLQVNFTDQSTGSPTSWIWDFGDGFSDTEQNVSHIYESAGNYTVNLTVSNENGKNSTSALIIVSEKPVTVVPIANFSTNVSEGYAPLSVQFTDLSENATDWTWDFGDGTNSTQQNNIHTYIIAGNYTVNLTVSNENGMNSTSTLIIVSEKPSAVLPVADFSSNVTIGTVPLSVQFTDLSENATDWTWDFGDGTNSTEQNPMHTYTSAGSYTVNLTVSNADGSDSEVKTGYIKVTVSSPGKPVAAFSASHSSGKAPLTVAFTDKSSNIPTKWKWSFGDGTTSFQQNPKHKYSKAGKYTVTLTVTNAKGSNTVTETDYIKVIAKPVANFTSSVTSGKAPLNVVFTDTSTGTASSWIWDFGDGSKSFVENPIHKYSKAGTYTVSLTVKNAAGSSKVTKTEYIKIITKPVANFTSSVTSGKAPLNVKFTDTSTGTASGWIWDFGDGSKSFVENPTHKYSKAGAYTVNLTVKNASGRNTVTKTDYIKVV